MHSETFSIGASSCAEGGGPEPGGPPAGRSFLQFASAASKAGAEGSIPAPSSKPPRGVWVWEVGLAIGAHALSVGELGACKAGAWRSRGGVGRSAGGVRAAGSVARRRRPDARNRRRRRAAAPRCQD